MGAGEGRAARHAVDRQAPKVRPTDSQWDSLDSEDRGTRDLPEDRFGPWKTVYNRFNKWSKEGVFDRILEALQLKANQAGKINWDLWCIDGSVERAHRVATGARGGGNFQG